MSKPLEQILITEAGTRNEKTHLIFLQTEKLLKEGYKIRRFKPTGVLNDAGEAEFIFLLEKEF